MDISQLNRFYCKAQNGSTNFIWLFENIMEKRKYTIWFKTKLLIKTIPLQDFIINTCCHINIVECLIYGFIPVRVQLKAVLFGF